MRPLWQPNPRRTKRQRKSPGFTLVEALMAIAIVGLASSVLFLAIDTSLNGAGDAREIIIADGLARLLVDEAITRRYSGAGSGAYQWPLCPNSYEMGGTGRERYDDADDFVGFTAKPAKDAWGVEMGQGNGAGGTRPANFRIASGYFTNWKQKMDVYYVSNTNLTQRLADGLTSDYRCIEAQIIRVDTDGSERLLAKVRRVIPYVPPPQ